MHDANNDNSLLISKILEFNKRTFVLELNENADDMLFIFIKLDSILLIWLPFFKIEELFFILNELIADEFLFIELNRFDGICCVCFFRDKFSWCISFTAYFIFTNLFTYSYPYYSVINSIISSSSINNWFNDFSLLYNTLLIIYLLKITSNEYLSDRISLKNFINFHLKSFALTLFFFSSTLKGANCFK